MTKKEKQSDELLNQLDIVMKQAKNVVSISPKTEVMREFAISSVEGFFYSNVIINHKNNLTEDNLKELGFTKKDKENIEKEFKELFERCDKNLRSGSNKGKINSVEYHKFKERMNKINKNSYKILLEVEKCLKFDSCVKCIDKFRKDISVLGKELKIERTKSKDGSLSVSIGFE